MNTCFAQAYLFRLATAELKQLRVVAIQTVEKQQGAVFFAMRTLTLSGAQQQNAAITNIIIEPRRSTFQGLFCVVYYYNNS